MFMTDWSYALAGFLVSTLFGIPPANPSNFHIHVGIVTLLCAVI